MSNNPYQPFFDQLDKTVDKMDEAMRARLVDADEWIIIGTGATDLLKRAGFVLANMLNVQAQVYPTLFLEPEAVEGEANDTGETSLE